MFDEKTQQNLKHYVYMLIDPDDTKPFYIGKGKDNRVFNHLAFALTDLDEVNAKYSTIRRIQGEGKIVLHVIVRHGLTETEAFHIEASNQVNGHNSIEKGLMSTDQVKRLYNAEPLNSILKNCVIININKNYKRGHGADAIYEATKGIWSIGWNELVDKQGQLKRKLVLSEYRGLIVEVFEVVDWYVAKRGYTPKAKKYGEEKDAVAFNGHVASDEIRNL